MNLDSSFDAVLNGQADAFLAIVRVHSPALRTYLGTQLFRQDEVDDLAQEVLITAYRRLPTFRRSDDFGAWLRGIARNKLMKHYEKVRRGDDAMTKFRDEVAHLIHGDLDKAASATKEVHLNALVGCIQKLPERMRKVIRAWLDGTRAAVLVDELKLTVANIYQIQHRATTALRDCIKEDLAHAE